MQQTQDEAIRTCGKPPAGQIRTPVTVVSPGPLTVRWEEYEAEAGSPYVISLVKFENNQFSSCTLLDHVPHNPAYEGLRYTPVDRAGCKLNGKGGGQAQASDADGVGGCDADYFVTIEIPNVVCRDCGLVVTNPTGAATTSNGTACHHKFAPGSATGEQAAGDGEVACARTSLPVFASCSRIEIRPNNGNSGANPANQALSDQVCHGAQGTPLHWPYDPAAGYMPTKYAVERQPYSAAGWLDADSFRNRRGTHKFVTADDRAHADMCAAPPVQLAARLTSDQENFAVDPLSGRELEDSYPVGVASATVDMHGAMRLSTTLDGLSSPIVGVHLHGRGCEDTAEAPVLADLTALFANPQLDLDLVDSAGVTKGALVLSIVDKDTMMYNLTTDGSLSPTTAVFIGAGTGAAGEIGGDTANVLLETSQVTPTVGLSLLGGSIEVVLTPAGVTYTLTLTDETVEDAVTAIHFHGPARRGEEAAPLVQTTGEPYTLTRGQAGQTFTFPPADPADPEAVSYAELFRTGQVYVNVHTAGAPAGRIRGQVEFVQHHLRLSGHGSGGVRHRRDHKNHLVSAGWWRGMTSAEMHSLRSGLVHLNVMVDGNANPALEVQVEPAPTAGAATLEGKQQTDAVQTRATGSVLLSLSKDGAALSYTMTFQGVHSGATSAHIHGPAKRGEDGGVLHTIFDDVLQLNRKQRRAAHVVDGGIATLGAESGSISGMWTPTASQMADLRLGLTYINLHSSAHPGGELRAQLELRASLQEFPPHHDSAITLDRATVDLVRRGRTYLNVHTQYYPSGEVRGQLRLGGGSQLTKEAIPLPSTETDGGGAWHMSALDKSGKLTWSLVSAKLSSDLVQAHIHGPASRGETAPVVETLIDLTTPDATDIARSVPLQTTRLLDGAEVNPQVDSHHYGIVHVVRRSATTVTVDARIETGMVPLTLRIYETYPGTALQIIAFPLNQGSLKKDVDLSAQMSNLKQGAFHIVVTSQEHPEGELAAKVVFGSHLQGTVELSATGVRHLFEGLLYVNVHTKNNLQTGEVRGQLARPSSELCPERPSPFVNTCFYTMLTSSQAVPKHRQTEFPRVHASAGYKLRDLGTLEYSVAVHSFKEQANTLRIAFGVGLPGANGDIVHEIEAVPIEDAAAGTIVYVGSWNARAVPPHLLALAEGKVYIAVFLGLEGRQILRGQVPALSVSGVPAPAAGSSGLSSIVIGQLSPNNLRGSGTRQVVVGQTLLFELEPAQNLLKASGIDECSGLGELICSGIENDCSYTVTEADLIAKNFTLVDAVPNNCRSGARVAVEVFGVGELTPLVAESSTDTKEMTLRDLADKIDAANVNNMAAAEFAEVLAIGAETASADAMEACMCAVKDSQSQTTLTDASGMCADLAARVDSKDIIVMTIPNPDASASPISSNELWSFGHQLSSAFGLASGTSSTRVVVDALQVVPDIFSVAAGGGSVNISSDAKTIEYDFSVSGAMVTAAHFHGPAERGLNAPAGVLHTLAPMVVGSSRGVWQDVPDNVMELFRRGLVYVNMHTAEHPNGGIRGQIEFNDEGAVQDISVIRKLPTSFSAKLSARNVGPSSMGAVKDSAGSGSGSFTLVGRTAVDYMISVSGLSATAAHIHGPAPRGVDAPTSVLHTLNFVDGVASGTWTGITGSQLSYLAKGELYVNIHTSAWPLGELRGQIEAADQRVALDSAVALTVRDADATGNPGQGGVAELQRCADNSCLRYNVTVWVPGAVTPPLAHFHGPAFDGFDGGVLETIPLEAGNVVGTFYASGTWQTSGDHASQILEDLVYINVHSAPITRGQVLFAREGERTQVVFSCPSGKCNEANVVGKELVLGSARISVTAGSFSVASAGDRDTASFLGTAIFLAILFGALFVIAIIAGDKGEAPAKGKKGSNRGGANAYEAGPSALESGQNGTTPVYLNPVSTGQTPAAAPRRAPPPRAPPARPQKAVWEPVVDPSSGDTYYINSVTDETTWELPPADQTSEA